MEMPAKFQAKRSRIDRPSLFWSLKSDPYITLRDLTSQAILFQIPDRKMPLSNIPPRSEEIRGGFRFGRVIWGSNDRTIRIGCDTEKFPVIYCDWLRQGVCNSRLLLKVSKFLGIWMPRYNGDIEPFERSSQTVRFLDRHYLLNLVKVEVEMWTVVCLFMFQIGTCRIGQIV